MKSRRTGLVLLLALVCIALAVTPMLARRSLEKARANAASFEDQSTSDALPVLWPIPAFQFTASDGPFDSKSLAGKVWVADFFLTSCEGACPVMATNMKTIYDHFANDDRVAFVSITVDPDIDVPEVLTQYANRYQVDTTRWHFLTGPVEDIHRVLGEGFKLSIPEHPMAHSQRFMVVDAAGNLRSTYMGTEEGSVPLIIADIETLLQEQVS